MENNILSLPVDPLFHSSRARPELTQCLDAVAPPDHPISPLKPPPPSCLATVTVVRHEIHAGILECGYDVKLTECNGF